MARWFNRAIVLAPLLCLASVLPATAQLNWRYFSRSSDGLEAGLPTYLSFSPRGNLWIRYRDDPMVTEIDGYLARSIPGPNTASGLGFRVYESIGGQLWTLYPDGVQWRDGDVWRSIPVPEIRDEMPARGPARPFPLLPERNNRLFVLLSDRLINVGVGETNTLIKDSASIGLGRFTDMQAADDGGVWITAENGIARVPAPQRRPDSIATAKWEIYRIPEDLNAWRPQHPFEDGDGGLLMLAEDHNGGPRVWLHFRGGRWSRELLPRGFKAAWITSDAKAWGLETTSLNQWNPPRTEMRDTDNIDLRPWAFSDVAMEPGGCFWVSARNGVWRYSPLSWRPPRGASDVTEAVYDIFETTDGTLWFLGAEHLMSMKDGNWNSFSRPAFPVRPNAATPKLGEFADGRLFYTDTDGLVTFSPGDHQFSRLKDLDGENVQYLGSNSNAVWFARTPRTKYRPELACFDGKTWSAPPLPQPDDVIGDWGTMIQTVRGDYWIGGTKGAARFNGDAWVYFTAEKRPFPGGVNAFLDLGDGTIWAGTRDGVASFNGQVWSILQSGISRVNRLTAVQDGHGTSVFLATDGELIRRHENLFFSLGAQEGAPTGIQVVFQSRDGKLWLGHDRGISVFHPEVDRDPPETYLDMPVKETYSAAETIVFGFSGKDRWKATSPDRLLYGFRIDENPWKFTTENRIPIQPGILPAGEHRFEVYALDRLLNRDLSPEYWQFKIVETWYRDYRVLTIVFLAAVVVVVFASLAVNRHLTLKRSYAEIERIVAERTHQLEQANRDLAHAEKMRSLGTLAAGVAHDFNSILSIIRGSIQIIETHPDNPDKVRTRISRIKSMVEQGSTLVKAMLGFSRADDVRLVLDDVGSVVGDAARLLSDRLPAEVELIVDVTPGLPPVHGTRELLQQILVNLMLNALDAMEQHGQIVLRCQRAHVLPTHWVLVPAVFPEYVAVAVEDTGSGISPENLSRVFEPFFTTKAFSTRHGTGLGLSMVYEFCKELGYGINVRSELKKGTCFTIYVPVLAANPIKPAETEARSS